MRNKSGGDIRSNSRVNSRMNSRISVVLAFILLVGPLLLTAGAQTAVAQVKRVAVVTELKGAVQVKKSGATKSFKAFNNMSLNEGDRITTGKGAKVVLSLSSSSADQDTVTVGENSQVDFTKLSDNGGTKTKMNVWAGSMWVKVKSISNASDTFEVETPTAIMGVRGTHFMIGVSPDGGQTQLYSVSGIVQANIFAGSGASGGTSTGTGAGSNQSIIILPSQQLEIYALEDTIENALIPLDMDQFIQDASPDIIAQIISNLADIQQENDRYYEQLRSNEELQQLQGEAGLTVEQTRTVLSTLLPVLINKAIEQNKLDEQLVREIVNNLNSSGQVSQIDLGIREQPQLTAEQQRLIEQRRQLAEQRQRQLAEQQQREEQQRAQNQALLDRLAAERQRQQAENSLRQQQQEQAARDSFLATLSASERSRFLERETNAQSGQNQQQPGTSAPGGTPGGGQTPIPVLNPQAQLAFSSTDAAEGVQVYSNSEDPLELKLELQLGRFTGNRAIAGYQLKLEYDSSFISFNSYAFQNEALVYRGGNGVFRVEPTNTIVANANSVDQFIYNPQYSSYSEGAQPVFSSVTYDLLRTDGGASVINALTPVLGLPFTVYRYSVPEGQTNVTVRISEFVAFDISGNPIAGIELDGELELKLIRSAT